MSSPPVAESRSLPSAPMSVALRNLCLTFALTIASLALASQIWRETGYEMLIVAMGWPHVILGFVFYFGRVLRGDTRDRTYFALLALLTLAIWAAHYAYTITGLIYLYFLYHAFRDEIFVYLQTRSRHASTARSLAVAGLGPLILLMLLVPQQQDFRHDLRRVEFAGGEQFNADGWTLITFRPVSDSRGRDFYFYLQAPNTAGTRYFVAQATTGDSRAEGEFVVNDRTWQEGRDLVFRPHYADDRAGAGETFEPRSTTIPVLLTGGHRVGQTFTAERDNLAGVWLYVSPLAGGGEATRFVLHLASPPLLPYSPLVSWLRWALIAVLSVLAIWKLVQWRGGKHQLWVYLIVLAAAFAGLQTILKTSNRAGYLVPLIFQFVVVFHYWSWYVFSFDRLRATKDVPRSGAVPFASFYDRMLGSLRRAPRFAAVVILLNVVSAAGVFWYYRLDGPLALRYVFDYNYFLYFLVFHVTFSFSPKGSPRSADTPAQSAGIARAA